MGIATRPSIVEVMTVRDLYEWAEEKGVLDDRIRIVDGNGDYSTQFRDLTKEDLKVCYNDGYENVYIVF